MHAAEFRAFGCGFRVWMNLAQWEMAEDESDAVSEMLHHKFDNRIRGGTVWAFVITVFNQCDRRIAWTENVITLRDWRFECRHAIRPPSAVFPERRGCHRRRD